MSEIVYVKTLPRRVDDVKVERGGTVNGVVMSASGASLVVTVKVDAATAERLKAGMAATLDLGEGTAVAAQGPPDHQERRPVRRRGRAERR